MATADVERFTDYTSRVIATGYLRRDQVVDALVDHAAGAIDPSDAADLVLALWDERLHTQARWPAVTDCDRLDTAFARLDEAGVLARQHYGCCLRHGFEALTAEPAATSAWGFVYFSQADTAHAVDGRGLQLAYGAFASNALPLDQRRGRVFEVGRYVVADLCAAGLDVQWAEDIDERILVDLDWERRLPTVESYGAVDA